MLISLFHGAVYSLLGVALLVLGFFTLDLLTPGRLGKRIYEDRSVNAAIVVSSSFLGLGAVQATAIFTNGAADLGRAFAWTAGFGVLGIILQAVSFLVLDAVTPGSLRRITVDEGFHPGAVVAAASMLAVSAVVCASIS
ncbi:DUF350 domain-containing protein [Austwickia chelonae]|uniref:DUF350 domain-containing protein n=1 Tax=Austwickia chelonae TaxID=100225 RepID=UPI000E2619A8|nr:DUF350 domain-containing protein [Austwickia chelonae]